jgi:D-alanyl-lipoteichoic acid acyltransferase DltB (MBOAT superfamily)
MLFNSFEFAIFFPIVTIGYFLLPHRMRWAWLLAASCAFYMAFIPVYIGILACTIVVDYWAAIQIERTTGRKRRLWLIFSIIVTCAILFVFKYFNFFNDSAAAIASALDLRYPVQVVHIILPIGLSFHTFQSLSYVIEVYRGNHRAEHHFGIYALYVMFYPQLVAGPIERPQGLLEQFRTKHDFDYDRVAGGLRLMGWGLFKKVVVADRLSLLVNPAFNSPHEYTGIPLVLATFLFGFQIYCDFSGYSDIAIGAAQTMGFRLRTNFNRPYAARSIAEFWKRWHMSLSTWFRDYVYLPLGGNRVDTLRWIRNILVTFLISGLWHGANWTFVIWGGLHGTYLLVGKFTANLRDKLWHRLGGFGARIRPIIAVVVTFILALIAWVPFRAASVRDAAFIMSTGIRQAPRQLLDLMTGAPELSGVPGLASPQTILLAITMITVVEFVELAQSRGDRRQMLATRPWFVRWAAYYAVGAAILLYGYFGRSQFIYFQF